LLKVKRWVLLFMGKPSQSYRVSPAIWDHTVLTITRHRWMRPILTPGRQAGKQAGRQADTRFTQPGAEQDIWAPSFGRRHLNATVWVPDVWAPNHMTPPLIGFEDLQITHDIGTNYAKFIRAFTQKNNGLFCHLTTTTHDDMRRRRRAKTHGEETRTYRLRLCLCGGRRKDTTQRHHSSRATDDLNPSK